MEGLRIYENPAFGKVRTAGTADEPMFCLSDVCAALGITNSRNVKDRLDKDDVRQMDITDSLGRTQLATFVTEGGLYETIIRSDSQQARPFRRWVTAEVLPSIRKTGGYSLTAPSYQISDPIARAQRWIEEEQVRQDLQLECEQSRHTIAAISRDNTELANRISEMLPKVSYYDRILNSRSSVTTTQIAQDYGMTAKRFNVMLRNYRIQHKVGGQWILYQPYLGRGYVVSRTIPITRSDGRQDTVVNTEWKTSGRLFLYEFLKSKGIIPVIER